MSRTITQAVILAATCRMIVRVLRRMGSPFDGLGDRSLAQVTFPHQSPKTNGSQSFPLRDFGNNQLGLFLKNVDTRINHARVFALLPTSISFFANWNYLTRNNLGSAKQPLGCSDTGASIGSQRFHFRLAQVFAQDDSQGFRHHFVLIRRWPHRDLITLPVFKIDAFKRFPLFAVGFVGRYKYKTFMKATWFR
jgi:hypothetical protein